MKTGEQRLETEQATLLVQTLINARQTLVIIRHTRDNNDADILPSSLLLPPSTDTTTDPETDESESEYKCESVVESERERESGGPDPERECPESEALGGVERCIEV